LASGCAGGLCLPSMGEVASVDASLLYLGLCSESAAGRWHRPRETILPRRSATYVARPEILAMGPARGPIDATGFHSPCRHPGGSQRQLTSPLVAA